MLQADCLSRMYGDVPAAQGVSFTVKAGEIVGLLGPNGAGKSTVLRMLAGILAPTSGRAVVAGFDARAQAFEARRHLGFLTGDTALYSRLTARETLLCFGRLHGLAEPNLRLRIDAVATQLQMHDFLDRQCGGLSAGQKQKTNVARAFLHNPDALILDEPTVALDIVSGRFLLDAIRTARAEGKAVLFSTHVMGEAEALCDRVLLIHHGRIIEEGPIAQVCQRAGTANLYDAFLHHLDRPEAQVP